MEKVAHDYWKNGRVSCSCNSSESYWSTSNWKRKKQNEKTLVAYFFVNNEMNALQKMELD